MSRYHDAHINPAGPGDARPAALQIIQDENLIDQMGDKVGPYYASNPFPSSRFYY